MESANQNINRQRSRRFEGDALRTIALPLGGIGTGTIGLGGRGQLRDFEIFNRPGKERNLPFTFFALWCRPEGGASVTRILERQMLPPFVEGGGIPPGRAPGLPRFREGGFRGEYPFGWVDLSDPAVPLALCLRGWNPMIPLNPEDSGIPAALLDWNVRNPTDTPVELAIALNVLNPVGWDGETYFDNRRAPFFGGNRNVARVSGSLRGIHMGSESVAEDDARFGTMAVGTTWPNARIRPQWLRGAWFDDLQAFWDDFSADGRLEDQDDLGASPEGQTDVGAVIAHARLEPGDSVNIPFLLTWCFPNLRNTWNTEDAVKGAHLGNYYARTFPDAWDAAVYVTEQRRRLETETGAFHDALFDGSLPAPILDAVSANMSIVRTTTCFRTPDGRLQGFEGCHDTAGCCPMNCTHVWNYAQSVAWLYPSLERTMRDTDFGHNTLPRGEMKFRTLLPLVDARWGFRPAADGQMGTVLRLYRDWRISGDTEWLRRLWPRAKAALEFAWSPDNPDAWDADHDGVMEGIQHNTYDIEFAGPNTMVGGWYLAALRAGAAMADALGEDTLARSWRDLAARGAAGYDATWNGEYYEQEVRFDEATQSQALTMHGGPTPVDDGFPRYQYGAGCLSDQLVGQWFARCVGLGNVLPDDKVKGALAAIGRHNFRRSLHAHESCQRVYALNDEAGLLLCSWPRGNRPRFPFPYADEVWTGIEYQVAAHMIYEGMVDEGLEITKAVRDRFDGARRNPWDEFECGHHYARAMSSWSLLLAWSGFQWNAAEAAIAFDPCVPGDARFFFSTNSAWGVYDRRDGEQTLRVLYGALHLRRWNNASPQALLNGKFLETRAANRDLIFESPVLANAGDTLVAGADTGP